jgi:hypothetical protein
MNDRIRELRAELAALDSRRRELQFELAAALAEAGRRPGDGSDQPTLFDPEAQSRLF